MLTREPGDLPMSRSQRLPGGVHREWEITMPANIPNLFGGLCAPRADNFESAAPQI
jgi:hypothetical protein